MNLFFTEKLKHKLLKAPIKKLLFLSVILLISSTINAQISYISGVIVDKDNNIVEGAIITAEGKGTTSNENGFYKLEIPNNKLVSVKFSYIGFEDITLNIKLDSPQVYEMYPVFKDVKQLDTVVVLGNTKSTVEGITTIKKELLREIPGGQPGVENVLKLLGGVSGNNELSSQYRVRGGNFDENLVYVNDIEVYRPFLIRSGQQEGLSFVNSDLVSDISFSAGGFQAKYGDKLSSVLDITYKTPSDFGASINMNLLGAGIAVEGTSKNKDFSGIVGVRYRDNSLFVNAKQTETNYDPLFVDVQTYLTYKLSDKFSLNFLGNAALNQYNYEPESRQTNFGTLENPLALLVFYQGQERDQYKTLFGALKANYEHVIDSAEQKAINLKFISSTYHTIEEEHYDILAQYRLGEVNTDIGSEELGEVEFSEGIGSQLNHARNDLDALIFNLEHKGSYTYNNKDNKIDWGLRYTHEDIRDKVVEWEVIDSAGFSIRPPFPEFDNDQPYTPFEGPLEPFQNIRAKNFTNIDRVSAYIQWSKRGNIKNHKVWYNLGVRGQTWTISGENIENNSQATISPRAQFAIKPDWNTDMIFRLAGGFYHQPPFYRELRDSSGTVRPNVKAQQSIDVVLGNDYNFKLWKRQSPFKLTTELYYKNLSNVNPYTIENVRIRYRARNNAKAYAYGLDMRLNGEFVPGTESWVSFGYLKTEENIEDRGYIARPTDQRLKFGILFQDYVPKIPNLKVYLNLTYNTGLPGGSPSYADPYDFQLRLPDYKRADVGFSYVIKDMNPTETEKAKAKYQKGHWLYPFKEFNIGFEIFNMFDVQNSITNTWVRDVYTKRQFAIPNFLTPRIFNLRMGMRF